MTEPLIVMVGPGLDGMEQLLASVRRRGVRTAWIGYRYPWHQELRARLFADQVLNAADVGQLAECFATLGAADVVDVICSERVLADTARAAAFARVARPVQRNLDTTRVWLDKLRVSQRLAEAGVRVPRTIDGASASPDAAIDVLGLPLVVKGRIGLAGTTVRVARTVDEVRDAVAQLGASEEGFYFEQHIAGQDYAWVCAHRDGQTLIDGSYVARRLTSDVTGPPDFIEPVIIEGQRQSGRRVVELLGGRGLLNIDFVQDAEGRDWLLDVNARPWHSTVSFRFLGVDFSAYYLATIGIVPDPAAVKWPVGERIEVYPALAATWSSSPPRALRTFARHSRRYAAWTGPGYVAAAALRSAQTLALPGLRRLGLKL